MMTPVLLTFAPLIVALAVAAVIDARYRRIPNWLTFALLLAGLGRAMTFGHSGAVGHALLGLLVGAGLAIVLYCISALGGGDVKLLAAIGVWIGPGPVLLVFLVEAVIGMVIVLTQAAWEGRAVTLLRNSAVIAANFACVPHIGLNNAIDAGKACRSVSRPLPYAVPIFAATLIVLLFG